jgi:hypothetical protein
MNGTLLTISVIHTYPALLLETGPRAIHTYPSTVSKSLIPSLALKYNKDYKRSSKSNKEKYEEKQKQQRPAKSQKETPCKKWQLYAQGGTPGRRTGLIHGPFLLMYM